MRALSMPLDSNSPLLAAYFLSRTRATVRKLVARGALAAGRAIHVEWRGRPYPSREVMTPAAFEARTLPGWAPAIPLKIGLAQMPTEPDSR